MLRYVLRQVVACLLLYTGVSASATTLPVTINFDSLTDSDSVTTQFSGLTFNNAIALQAGVSLNEFEFPPRSGDIVISDLGGPISILFASPISQIEGHFTYLTTLSITAFDAGGGLLGSVTSSFSNSLALSGEPGSSPNELLSFSSGLGILSLLIAGDGSGGSFTLDDVTYLPADTSPPGIPEPKTILLFLSGLGILMLRWREKT